MSPSIDEVGLRYRIMGTAKALADMTALEGAETRLRLAARRTGEEHEASAAKIWLRNQALFTARRLLYGATLATLAFTTAAVGLGFQFNMTMENSTVALSHFLGSEEAARKELDYLYELAAKTPFEFPQLASAARRFLAFGYTLQDTNRYLSIIGDTVAGMGGNADDIEHLVLVFGQIRASGRLLGQDMLQLEQRGIPAIEILQKQLGLTAEQTARIGELAIPASVGIPALMRGMAETFGGSAKEQAKTLQGQISTMHDYAAQLMGTLTMPLYERFRDHIIPQVNRILTDIGNANREAQRIGGPDARISFGDMIRITDRDLGLHGRLIFMMNQLGTLFRAVGRIFTDYFLPGIKIAAYIIIPTLTAAFVLFVTALDLFSRVGVPMKALISILIILWASYKTGLILAWIWEQRKIISGGLLNIVLLIQKSRLAAVTIWQYRWIFASGGMVRAYKALTTWAFASARAENGRFIAGYANNTLTAKMVRGLVRFRTAMITTYLPAVWAAVVATWAWTVALLSNPITWVVLGIAALVVAVLLATHSFDDIWHLIQRFWGWITSNWRVILLLFMPIAAPILYAGQLIDWIWGKIQVIWNHIQGIINAVKHAWGWLFGGGGGGTVQTQFGRTGGAAAIASKPYYTGGAFAGRPPGMAAGGFATQAGWSWVGERGPELMHVPRGATVLPLNQSPMRFRIEVEAPVVMKVNGRELANEVARWRIRTEGVGAGASNT